MTLFSRTSNPFLPSIRVRVVPFGVVHLSPARTGSSQVTRSLQLAEKCPTTPHVHHLRSLTCHPASYFFTGDPSAFPGPFSLSVGGTSVLTRFIPSLRSPSTVHHRALCLNSPQVVQLGPKDLGLVKPITQIPGSPIGNCLSLPVFFHLFFRIPYLDPLPVLLFHHYLDPPGVPTYTPSFSIPELLAGPSRFYGCDQADRSPLHVPVTQRVHIHIGQQGPLSRVANSGKVNAASPAILSHNSSLVSPSLFCSRNNFLPQWPYAHLRIPHQSGFKLGPRQGQVFFVRPPPINLDTCPVAAHLEARSTISWSERL
ncbi:unnamed protein product [Acanthosepion pharaonis]|uniref:Uncharacterized protein n=1 Tax=Acanthosepion pharaonis TaxID=158019 RepID=A0A812DG98_ACAPH|nr:unnamed protein product [Sepia pharaonis]